MMYFIILLDLFGIYPQIYIGFIDTSLESPVCKLLLNDVGFFVAIFYY